MSYFPVAPLPDVNARQVAQVIRPPSTSLLTIDSEDRFANYTEASAAAALPAATLNATPYYYAIRKKESLMNGFFTRIGVSEVNFPWGIPNINRKTNTMIVNWAGSSAGTGQITIAEGFYTPHELAAEVQGNIWALSNDLSGHVTVTYGYLSQPIFYYETDNVALQINFEPMDYDSAAYPFPNTTKQLFHLMGFSDLNSTIISNNGSGGYTLCQAIRYIDICCFQLTNNQALKDQTSQTIARDALCRVYLGDGLIPGNIPINLKDASGNDIPNPDFCPPGCAPMTIYRNFTMPKQIQWIPNQPIPGYLLFQVFDDAGAALTEILTPVPAGSLDEQASYLDWSMTMLVSEN